QSGDFGENLLVSWRVLVSFFALRCEEIVSRSPDWPSVRSGSMLTLFRSSPNRRLRRHPEVEALEDRCTPANFTFSNPVIATPNPMAMATQPPTGGTPQNPTGEIEAADDFIVPDGITTNLTGGTFTGLLPVGATLTDVSVEIYSVFPTNS